MYMDESEQQETMTDGTTHYIKTISEVGERSLRVVMNIEVIPNRVITVFFDRRIRR